MWSAQEAGLGEMGSVEEVGSGEAEEVGSAAEAKAAESALASRMRLAVVDVQLLAEKCGLGSCGAGYAGLKATCAHWLNQHMAKGEQTSDWASRPLRPEQLSYAALDASACLRTLAAIEADWCASDSGAELNVAPAHLRLLDPRLVRREEGESGGGGVLSD